MALRNAFDLLGTEGTLRKILAAVTYARTTTDAMRVNVENQQSVNVLVGNSGSSLVNAGIQPGLYSNAAWNLDDQREVAREASELHFVQTRNRWTIT